MSKRLYSDVVSGDSECSDAGSIAAQNYTSSDTVQIFSPEAYQLDNEDVALKKAISLSKVIWRNILFSLNEVIYERLVSILLF